MICNLLKSALYGGLFLSLMGLQGCGYGCDGNYPDIYYLKLADTTETFSQITYENSDKVFLYNSNSIVWPISILYDSTTMYIKTNKRFDTIVYKPIKNLGYDQQECDVGLTVNVTDIQFLYSTYDSMYRQSQSVQHSVSQSSLVTYFLK